MNRKQSTIIVATALAVGVGLAGCSTAPQPTGGASSASSTSATASVHNGQDVAFAQMMLPHHRQAIAMSDMLLAKGAGVDQHVAALATRIKAEQAPEIATLTGWLHDWGATSSMPGMRHTMSGMMSDSDMSKLDDASPADAGVLFLRQMIKHHTSAVDMARTEVTQGRNAGAVAMAGSIVSSQTEQIDAMKDMLASR